MILTPLISFYNTFFGFIGLFLSLTAGAGTRHMSLLLRVHQRYNFMKISWPLLRLVSSLFLIQNSQHLKSIFSSTFTESQHWFLGIIFGWKVLRRLNASWKISSLAVNGQSFLVIDGFLLNSRFYEIQIFIKQKTPLMTPRMTLSFTINCQHFSFIWQFPKTWPLQINVKKWAVSPKVWLVNEKKVDRVTANHSLSSTASQGTSNIPFPCFLVLGCNCQAKDHSSYIPPGCSLDDSTD